MSHRPQPILTSLTFPRPAREGIELGPPISGVTLRNGVPKTVSPQEAAALVRPVDSIGFGLGPANPDAFLTALGSRDDWEDLVLGGALLLNFYDVLTKPGVSYRCGFFGPAERLLFSMGHRIELVPGGFRQFAPILARFAPRIMVAQAAPPGDDGNVNLSLHLGATRPELLRAGTRS